MFGMGMSEILIILAVALIILGPKKLPEMAKALGRGIAEFRKATQDFKESLETDDDLKEARDTMREIKGNIEETIQDAMTDKASLHAKNAGAKDDAEPTFSQDTKDIKETPPGLEPDKTHQQTEPEGPSKDA